MSKSNVSEPDYLSLHLRSMAPHRAILRSIEAKFMSQVPLVHPVLDIGSGDGHFASVAYREPIDVGIDVMDRDMEEAATLRPSAYRELVKASATRCPFGTAHLPRCSAIVCSNISPISRRS